MILARTHPAGLLLCSIDVACDHNTHYRLIIHSRQLAGDRELSRAQKQLKETHQVKPGFHPNAITCVACVAFGWKPG